MIRTENSKAEENVQNSKESKEFLTKISKE
jgi:hypothetical protein